MEEFPKQLFQNNISAGNIVPWTIDTLHAALNNGKALRSTERSLKQTNFLPSPITPNFDSIKAHASLILPVFNSLISEARRKRRPVLTAQVHTLPNETQMVVVNDARGKREWLFLDPESDNHWELMKALIHERNALVFPVGELTKLFEQKVDDSKSHRMRTSSGGVLISGTIAYKNQKPLEAENAGSKLSALVTAENNAAEELGDTHLDHLESQSIHIMREVMAYAENPVMLYSIGKDSGVMLHLAQKAFYPSRPPFPLLHVDTRWKFHDMYRFRDFIAKQTGMELITHTNPDGVKRNINPFDHGSAIHTEIMKTEALKQALDSHGFDFAFGGARRDEEKSRAKERIFSFRTQEHAWDPKNQRPELWSLYNGVKNRGESVRVFPLSNWTELDVWLYIFRENIPIVPLYFAKERPVVERDGSIIMVDDERMRLLPKETIQTKKVRFRTLGCYPLTGAVESEAADLESILLELMESRMSERTGRVIDSDSSSSMEKKKRHGYF